MAPFVSHQAWLYFYRASAEFNNGLQNIRPEEALECLNDEGKLKIGREAGDDRSKKIASKRSTISGIAPSEDIGTGPSEAIGIAAFGIP